MQYDIYKYIYIFAYTDTNVIYVLKMNTWQPGVVGVCTGKGK